MGKVRDDRSRRECLRERGLKSACCFLAVSLFDVAESLKVGESYTM